MATETMHYAEVELDATTANWTQAPAARSDRVFQAGNVLGERYEIIALLGEGGWAPYTRLLTGNSSASWR